MDALIYDEEYYCYFRGEFIGIATYTDDPFLGNAFIKMEVHEKRGLEEIIILPDEWILNVEQDH